MDAKERDRRNEARRSDGRILGDIASCAFGYCSIEEITRAKTKPAWCSEQRWRMELARRRDREYYATFGEL